MVWLVARHPLFLSSSSRLNNHRQGRTHLRRVLLGRCLLEHLEGPWPWHSRLNILLLVLLGVGRKDPLLQVLELVPLVHPQPQKARLHPNTVCNIRHSFKF